MSDDRETIGSVRHAMAADKPDAPTAHPEVIILAINLMGKWGYALNEIIDIVRDTDETIAKGALR